jgi:Arc/MetJ-type ribon-helix-helix transcriptional regulator
MRASIPVIHKKRGPPPTGKTPIISLRLPDDYREAIDAWIAEHPDPKPSRSEAIRFALKDWLTGLRLLPSDKQELGGGR